MIHSTAALTKGAAEVCQWILAAENVFAGFHVGAVFGNCHRLWQLIDEQEISPFSFKMTGNTTLGLAFSNPARELHTIRRHIQSYQF